MFNAFSARRFLRHVLPKKPHVLANFGTDLYIQHLIKYNILFTKKAPGYEADQDHATVTFRRVEKA